MKLRFFAILGAAAVAALVTGCSGNAAGGTPPTSSAAPASTSAGGSSGSANDTSAPKVANPISAGSLLHQPCKVLTQAQLTTLHFPGAKSVVEAAGY
ncbi:MAG: hypothetical protein J2O49_09525, partial [Sciscionella sp.]|nr:hypothetical protein [Sciscionella sp.]